MIYVNGGDHVRECRVKLRCQTYSHAEQSALRKLREEHQEKECTLQKTTQVLKS